MEKSISQCDWLVESNYSGAEQFSDTIRSFVLKNPYPKRIGCFDLDDIVQEISLVVYRRNFKAIQKTRNENNEDWKKMSLFFNSNSYTNQAHIDIMRRETKRQGEPLTRDVMDNLITDSSYMNSCFEEAMHELIEDIGLEESDLDCIEKILNKKNKKQTDLIISKMIKYMAEKIITY
jgi:hypothetical protein